MAPRGEDIDEDLGGSPPDTPTNLEITDWDETSVKLKWNASVNDGGAPITGYVIEYKGRTDEDWTKGPKVFRNSNPLAIH